MRLIDADTLLNSLKKNVLVDVTSVLEEVIESQPTVYNLDKIIEDLEKYAHSDICHDCHRCRYINEDNINCEQCGALGALEIAKELIKNTYVN